MSEQTPFPCPQCQIGHLQPGHASFTTLHGAHLLSAELAAWTCDICGYMEFDYDALAELDVLTGQANPNGDLERPAIKPALNLGLEARPRHRLKP